MRELFKTSSGARAAGVIVRNMISGGEIKVRQMHAACAYVVSVTSGPVEIVGRATDRWSARFTFAPDNPDSLAVSKCLEEDGATPAEAIQARRDDQKAR